MGVPKFYRWISERYPKINQIVSDSTLLPEFDNLYLDMNGILHTCTHPNDDGLSAQLSERDIILGIFHYIDRIVTHIVRPRRVLYMAIDGVAPRAKMNQQRSRRFRSRKDMKDAKLIAESKGEVVNEADVFDSNCITPGTEFMAKVSRHLRYFIQKKVTEDPLWKALTVTFSGHEVPGEGEHKIMAYIRDERSAGRLPSNTRHCMYGQDADLILLGLVTHEPHFTLLREVVNFGQNASRGNKSASKVVVKTTRDAQFQLLHLSLLREYIWAEFTRDIPAETEAQMERERVVDDFVFLTFLVGNDFLPHMPSLDIGEEAFALLFQIYRSLKPGWGGAGYLTREGGIDNAQRLEQFLEEVGSREDAILKERASEEAEFRERRRRTGKRFGHAVDDIPSEGEVAEREEQLQDAYEGAMQEMIGFVPWMEGGGKNYKGRYYFEKFGITPLHTDVHERLRAAYVEGLVWCLAYYYRGCVSWSWFFPFHYVPMISDLKGLGKIISEVKFDLGEPFLPFEQLLGCLPGASAGFLPTPYARLMTSLESPIIDFYPEDFEVDMNGKRNSWEAVNLLPFIDAYRLKAAVAEHCPRTALRQDEAERNTLGKVLEYYHDPRMNRAEMSCNPEIGLADIRHCTAAFRVVPFSIEPGECFKPELPSDAVIPTAGFPSLHVLSVRSVEECKIPINVFGSPSRYDTLVIQLKRPPELPPAASLASRVLGKSTFLNWPLMHEAQVVAISDNREEYRLREVKNYNCRRTDVRTFSKQDADRWRLKAAEEQEAYMNGRGVPGSGGVDIGKVQLMLKARPLQGMRVDPSTGARHKVFGKEEADVPVHMVLWSCPAEDPRFRERESATLEESFPVGGRVICLHGGHGHGCGGEVAGYQGSKVDVIVDLRPPEPPFGLAVVQSVKTHYFPQQRACKILMIKASVFGRVVGSVLVEPGKLDLGLNLKQNDRYQLLGYSRCILHKEAAWSTSDTVKVVGSAPEAEDTKASSWEFSAEAVRLVDRYRQAFPQLFENLASYSGTYRLDANALFGGGGKKKAEEIADWLSKIETAGMQRMPLTTKALSREAVKAVERGADVRQALMSKNALVKKTLLRGLEPCQLLAYHVTEHTDAPMDTGGEKPDLGDRVVNMRAKGVPFGLWGTVIASHSHSGCVEVVFDEEFIGGTTLHGMCSNYRGALVPWATVAKVHTRARLEALRASAAPRGSTAAAAASVPNWANSAKGRRGTTSRAEASAPATKKVSILRHPATASTATGARAGGELSSSEALKGALGIIKLSDGARTPASHAAGAMEAAPEAATGGGGFKAVPANADFKHRVAGTSSTTISSRTGGGSVPSAGALADALLKGILGVGAPCGTGLGAEGVATDPGPLRASSSGPTAAAAEAAAGVSNLSVAASGLVPAGCGAVSVSELERAQRQPSMVSTSASTSISESKSAADLKATADLKALIGVGLVPEGDRMAVDQPAPSSTAGGERKSTPSRQSRRAAAQLSMSPKDLEHRGRAHFRQAKGPDKVGSGFKVERGFGGGRGGGRGSEAPAAPAIAFEAASPTPIINTARAVECKAMMTPEEHPPITERLINADIGIGIISSGSDGIRDHRGTAGPWDNAVVVSAGSRPLAVGGGAMVSSNTERGDEATTRSRVIQTQGATGEGVPLTTPATTPASGVPSNTIPSRAQQLMNIIGAGRPLGEAVKTAVVRPVARSGSFVREPGASSNEAVTEGREVGVLPPNDLVPSGKASPSPQPLKVHPRHQHEGRRQHEGWNLQQPISVEAAAARQQQQHVFARQEVPLPLSGFLPPGQRMGAADVGGGGGGAQQRVLWQQQRLLEAFQLQQRQQQQQQQQQRHHAFLQQQQQQLYAAVRAAPVFPQAGTYPSGVPPSVAVSPGVPFVQAQPYQQYGYQSGAVPPHPHNQMIVGGYLQPQASIPFSAPGAAPAASTSASPKIPRKSRKTTASGSEKSAAGGGEGGSAPPSMMIPSSALLAGSRRGLRASPTATVQGGDEGRRSSSVAEFVAGGGGAAGKAEIGPGGS